MLMCLCLSGRSVNSPMISSHSITIPCCGNVRFINWTRTISSCFCSRTTRPSARGEEMQQEGWNSHLNVSHERIPPRRLNHAMTGIFLHSRYLSCRLKRPPSFLSLRSQLWEVFRVEQSSCNRSDVCSGMLESVTGYTQIYNEVIEYLSM